MDTLIKTIGYILFIPIGLMFVLLPIGELYWFWMAIQMGSFWDGCFWFYSTVLYGLLPLLAHGQCSLVHQPGSSIGLVRPPVDKLLLN